MKGAITRRRTLPLTAAAATLVMSGRARIGTALIPATAAGPHTWGGGQRAGYPALPPSIAKSSEKSSTPAEWVSAPNEM